MLIRRQLHCWRIKGLGDYESPGDFVPSKIS